jgi:hypothetical protein
LFGSGIVVGSGDAAGSTAYVSAEISNTKFLNAWPVDASGNPTTGGLNDLFCGISANAILDLQVLNNTFDDVDRPLANAGVITINTNDQGRLGSPGNPALISGNTLKNIGSQTAAGTGGYIAIRFAPQSTSAIAHRLKILNNQLFNIVNKAMLVDSRDKAIANVEISGNTVGTIAQPVGQNNQRGIDVVASDNTTMNLLVQNNTIVADGSGSANSALSLTSGTPNNTQSPTATLNATITGNTISNINASAGTLGRFRARTLAPASPNTNISNLCLTLTNNVLEDASKVFELSHNSTGSFNRSASGNTGTVTTSGTIGSVASCTTPSF